jgi:putative ABC transport system permease protein
MWFISLVMKNVWRRKVRSILTCTSMAIAVCAVISMLGTAEGYEQSFAALYEARGTDLVVVQAGKTQRIASHIDESLLDRISNIPGVQDVEGTLIELASFPAQDLYGIYVFGLNPASVLMEDSKMKQGRKLTDNDRRKVMMGSMLARNLDKKLGDKVEIIGEPFEIIAIYDSFNLLESNGAVIPLRESQELQGLPSKVTTILILLEPSYKTPEKVEEVRKAISALRSPTGAKLNIEVQSTRDHVKTNFETQVFKGFAWASSMIAMIIGFVSMLNTMMMSITERIREIATFRALGWRKLRIMRMIILESLMLAAAGALLGMLLAIPLMEFLSNYSATSTMVVARLSAETIGKGVGMGMAAGLLGAIYPAFIAANLSPASALRHE